MKKFFTQPIGQLGRQNSLGFIGLNVVLLVVGFGEFDIPVGLGNLLNFLWRFDFFYSLYSVLLPFLSKLIFVSTSLCKARLTFSFFSFGAWLTRSYPARRVTTTTTKIRLPLSTMAEWGKRILVVVEVGK